MFFFSSLNHTVNINCNIPLNTQNKALELLTSHHQLLTMQITASLIATLAAITPALAQDDCQLVSQGPGEEAGMAVFDFFLRDYVQPQFHDEVCPLGQDRKL